MVNPLVMGLAGFVLLAIWALISAVLSDFEGPFACVREVREGHIVEACRALKRVF